MLTDSLPYFMKRLAAGLSWKKLLLIVGGAAICSFGLYNIHQQSGITEGGILGLMLFFNHWFSISPTILTPILDFLCYAVAFKYLGAQFLKISAISTLSVAFFFDIWERFPPMLPNLSGYPLVAALLGGIFVGVGVGVIVRQGGSSGGDDALALTISHLAKCRIARAYLVTDFVVLGLSLSYIPLQRIAFSVVTVLLSSFIIDRLQSES